MKSDKLNLLNACRSRAKIALFATLVAGSAGMPFLNANNSRTPHVVLNQLANGFASKDAHQLQALSARAYTLFRDFFDTNNRLPYKTHKAQFERFIKDLEAYKHSCSREAYSNEVALLAYQMAKFIKILDKYAQPIIKKGAGVTNADIIPLAMPLKDYSFLIPDEFFYPITNFLTAIRHRLSCS